MNGRQDVKRYVKTRRRRGSTLLEFALIVPVLIMILLGIMEFGWYTKNQLAIANGTREGVRMMAVGALESTVKNRVKSVALPTVVNDSDITLSYSSKLNGGATYGPVPADRVIVAGTSSTTVNGALRGDFVKVTTSVPYKSLTGLPVFTNPTIKVEVTMLRE